MSGLSTEYLVSINDLTASDVGRIFSLTGELKDRYRKGIGEQSALGKSMGMIFDKSSTRTRLSFECAMVQLGGYAIYLQQQDVQLGLREAVKDMARVVSRYLDAIMIRTSSHKTIRQLAEYADIPVINGMSDEEHPCQALTDLYTVTEMVGPLQDVRIAFVGDSNNVCRSLALLSCLVGGRFVIASPGQYSFDADDRRMLQDMAGQSGAEIVFTEDPVTAVRGCSVVYTDVWISMGQEQETARRLEVFQPYQVNRELLSHAQEDVKVMHCLPAHRGEEISDEVLDGACSIVYDQAENRMHVQKSLIQLLLSEDRPRASCPEAQET